MTIREVVVDHSTARGTLRALELPSLDIEQGTSLAVMGPSGCGKSTLLALVAGLSTPTRGSVTVADIEVSSLPERERIRFRRERIGMVYQDPNLLPHLTVEENVTLPLAITGHPPPDDPEELLDALGLAPLARRFPDELSGGQRQRAAVARAIVHRPSVILADEPTGSLDAERAAATIDLLTRVQRDIGATLILVTHDPLTAAHADRIEALRPPSSDEVVAHAG